MKKKNVLMRIVVVTILIGILWIIGIVPKIIGKQTAISYVKDNYREIGVVYKSIEFSTAYGDYVVSFSDEADNTYSFRLSPKYFPRSAEYDSIRQSNVN